MRISACNFELPVNLQSKPSLIKNVKQDRGQVKDLAALSAHLPHR